MYGFVVTTAGLAMLTRAAAGEELTVTGVQVGKGMVASQSAALALTALIDPVAAATSSEPLVSGSQMSMIVEYRNDMNGGLETGFDLSEFGIFASIGDDQPAMLYYASLGDSPQPIQPESEGLDIHRFPVAIAVTGDIAVTLDYPAGAFVTVDTLGNYIQTASVVSFTASQWTGEDTKTLTIPKTSHGRQSEKFGYTLYHLVSGVYKRSTWAVLCTDVSYDTDTQAIVLTGEDAYDGKIVFLGG